MSNFNVFLCQKFTKSVFSLGCVGKFSVDGEFPAFTSVVQGQATTPAYLTYLKEVEAYLKKNVAKEEDQD